MKNRLIKKAFTLIELLIVTSIIALLVSILLPSLNLARDKAKLVVCSSNLHSIGTYQIMYNNEENKQFYFGGYFDSGFINLQKKYNVPLTLFDCPGSKEDPKNYLLIDYETYTYNIKIIFKKLDRPAEFPSLWDKYYLIEILLTSLDDNTIILRGNSPNHKFKYTNILFLDSHVETKRYLKY